jgi:hypothetical protein
MTEPIPAEAAPSVAEPARAEAIAAPTGTAEPAPAQPVAPPARWPEADKAQFASWPADVQNAVLERQRAMEADYTRKTQALAEVRKSHEPLLAAVTRWSPYLRELSLTPDEAFGQMLGVERTLRHGTPQQKLAMLAELAERYAIPIKLAAGPAMAGPAAPPLPPAAEPFRPAARIEEKDETRARQWAQAELAAFAEAKDEWGRFRHPHFERVKGAMIRLVADDLAASWDDAYAKAVRLDDELHHLSVESERRRVLAAEERRRQEAVEKARRARPVRTSTVSPSGALQVRGLDAHLDAAMERSALRDPQP